MISSGGKTRRALFVLTTPLVAVWILFAFIWGGEQGVAEVVGIVERWMKP